MIDINELRRGNQVKCLTNLPIGFHISFYPMARILEIKENVVETETGTHKYRDIAPIPLSEEILVNNGGNKISDKEIVFRDNENDLLPIALLMEENSFYLGDQSGKRSIAIESVHQFQNIYYALKGKDIRIKITE